MLTNTKHKKTVSVQPHKKKTQSKTTKKKSCISYLNCFQFINVHSFLFLKVNPFFLPFVSFFSFFYFEVITFSPVFFFFFFFFFILPKPIFFFLIIIIFHCLFLFFLFFYLNYLFSSFFTLSSYLSLACICLFCNFTTITYPLE